ncbi:UV DNA damage repair endonuclease UvsE [Adhaeribacter arboris]|uniref:UV DNA damage repair endonuclease UvsE n=1 Tax=Adhaeribacter arboris TaxID=2072846 RepID=A0A2T2YFG5_9BACT|nr:UV DNA damage repair endonuclease UvsE [Adhaeribacter arboris]PSR54242.1 UV DNA damage repair endonuclease UvsE [Adhaeribacter arboris]
MKIGYPCINNGMDCTPATTFRLASYSEERLISTTANNFACLKKILEYNVKHNLLFLRMSSDMVPFASHPVNTYNWQTHFQGTLRALGRYIKAHQMRISMHPDQFVVINSPNTTTLNNSFAELEYQCAIMDIMELDETAKLQIHGGGVYGDKPAAIKRFVENYFLLSENVRKRLVIENDDRSYSLSDCLEIHEQTGIPILFDNFHHECLNNGETMTEALHLAAATWQEKDGIMMMDYSSQSPGERKGKHTASIVEDLFRDFIQQLDGLDVDIMLEIKDKELSALKAVEILEEMGVIKV